MNNEQLLHSIEELHTVSVDEALMLMYASEAYYEGPDSRLRYFSIRTDGFVSVSAKQEVGDLITHPLTFTGNRLILNCVSHDTGNIRVELQRPDGTPVPGFELEHSVPVIGDAIAAEVRWNSQARLSELAGTPVRILFRLQQADLYSLQFQSP